MRPTFRRADWCVAALTVALSLTACTNDDPSAAPPTPAAPQATSGEATAADDTTSWCAAYAGIATNLGALGGTPEDATSGISLLATFDRLWISAGELGLVTAAEVAANRTAVAGYTEVLQMVADGASQEEVQAADVRFTTSTEEIRETLTSSSDKIIEACQLPNPSASAAP